MYSIKLANYCHLLLILIFALLLVDSTRKGARSGKKRKLSPETVDHTSTDTFISSIKKGDQWRPLKVLVLTPVSGFSHFQLTAKFAEILAERGHYVVCFHRLFFKFVLFFIKGILFFAQNHCQI